MEPWMILVLIAIIVIVIAIAFVVLQRKRRSGGIVGSSVASKTGDDR